MKYAFYPGCVIPLQAPNYEVSARAVMKELEIPIEDIEDFGCCGVLSGPIDGFTMLSFAARNIALAETRGLDILTLCNGCFGTLSKAVHQLEDAKTRDKVNTVLKEIGLEVQGKSQVHHFHRVLCDTIGLDEIKKRNKVDMSGCKIGCHNGCHLVKPADVLHFDKAAYPHKLEEMVEATSAQVVTPRGFEHCCGSLLMPHDQDSSYAFAVKAVEQKGEVDAIIVNCPGCFRQLDLGQVMAKRKFNKVLTTPVVFYSQLLGLALGIDPKALALDTIHKIKTAPLLEKCTGHGA
jgi:heterodisulfide reductase subunit B